MQKTMSNLSFPTSSRTAIAAIKGANTGVEFPVVLGESRKLLGVGKRRRTLFGLKSIDIYAFGIYADDCDVKKLLKEKYGESQVVESSALSEDLTENDVCMTIRLQIIYGKLSAKLMVSAIEENVSGRLKKFSGQDNKELLQRFTSLFKDKHKISPGTIIDISREKGYVLSIDGKEMGSTESEVLCRSILDLYVGDNPFDKNAKEDFERNTRTLLCNWRPCFSTSQTKLAEELQ